ncbi:porin [Halomonas janggokensis]|uniref:Porin n=1 Tax=Vreelandella janggokensis TaxID=370767 RepID=A0ABT4ITK5_9GAMM|nr:MULTISPECIES: porin [Halomonas]MCW4148485.1 porin [Halomonas sp. 18H]MCZ0926999.1 porin [Halomonas janggokensis]MCZ0929537.1 porin [Halomonas janggokensis]
MKKTLLATAIAGAAFASGAQAATIYNEDGTKLDLYGNIQLAYYNVDQGDDSEDELTDNGSTVGFAGEHLITSDLTGYFKAEFEHDADEAKTAGGLNTGDQAYMGLKGGFGDARLGSWDPLIDDWIQDPITNNEAFDVSDSNQNILGIESREGNKLAYTSPSFNGLQFAIGTQFEGDAEAENFSGSSNASAFGGVKYTAGAFSIAAAYDNLDNNDGEYTAADDAGFDAPTDYDAGEQYGITAQYTIDTLRIAAKLERYQAGDDNIEDVNYYGVGARYGYGNGDIYGAYQYVDVGGDTFLGTADSAISEGDYPNDGGESYNEVVLGATYNVSDAMYTFVEAAMYDREDDVDDGVAVGAVYLF